MSRKSNYGKRPGRFSLCTARLLQQSGRRRLEVEHPIVVLRHAVVPRRRAKAIQVDDGGSQAAAADAVERPDEDHVEFPPSGVGGQLSILRFTAISPLRRALVSAGIAVSPEADAPGLHH